MLLGTDNKQKGDGGHSVARDRQQRGEGGGGSVGVNKCALSVESDHAEGSQ